MRMTKAQDIDTSTVTRQTMWMTKRYIFPSPWGTRPGDAAQYSKIYAYYKTTSDSFVTRDGMAVSRLTITFERKDDGQRKTTVVWVSNDYRTNGASPKLRDLLIHMRPRIALAREGMARCYSDQKL
jgi:hypothetical protein